MFQDFLGCRRMIHTWRIGDAAVTSLVEYVGPTHAPEATFPAFNLDTFRKRGDDVVIIDTGVGNYKVRPPARMHMLNTLVPQWLAAAGAEPDVVTHVLITHLHSDHIGWNTSLEDQRWAPTFPKARYLVPKTDYDYFKGLNDSGKAGDTSFADSLAPIFDAGLVTFVNKSSELP